MKKLIFLVFLGIILSAGFLIAATSPPNPMAFYGEVIYEGGIPDGYYITAKIDNSIHGQCLIINDKYGYDENTCIVVSDDLGATIDFYIGSTLIGSHPFKDREIVELDFTLTTLPPKPLPLSNGICEVDLGECSFNFLDCHVSLTDVCTGNSRCDVEIGETCSISPSDCGTCPINLGDDDDGSSGGGGGSSGGSSPTFTEGTFNTGTNTNLESDENSQNLGGGITGAAIGSSGGTNFLPLLILLVLIVAGMILFFAIKKSKKEGGDIKGIQNQ